MPDTYERRRRDRWLYELAGVPVDDEVAPTYRDLRLAEAAPLPRERVDPATGMLLRDEDRGVSDVPPTGDELAPKESAPHATPSGTSSVDRETGRWETTSFEDAKRFDAEDAARRQLTLDPDNVPSAANRWAQMELRTGIPPLDKSIPWPKNTPFHTASNAPPSRAPEPIAERAELAQDEAAGTPAPRPSTARDDPWEFLAQPTELPAPHVQFNPFEARERASRLYGRDDDAPDDSHRWEREYLGTRRAITDEEIERRWRINHILGGTEQGAQLRSSLEARQQRYLEGLSEAREHDYQETMRDARIPRGLAQAIAASGLVSPEDAVRLRMNDPVVKAFMNGGYQFGSSYKRAETGAYLDERRLQQEAQADANRDKTAREAAALRAQQEQAEAERKRAEEAQKHPPTNPTREAAFVRADANLTAKIAARLARGEDLSDLPASMQAEIEASREKWRAMSPQEQSAALTAQVKGEGRERDLTEGTLTRQRNNPQTRDTRKAEIQAMAGRISNAQHAWQAMSDKGKEVFVQIARTGNYSAIFSSAMMPPEDRKHAGRAQALMNWVQLMQSGQAVSGSESERNAIQMGITASGWNPFNDTSSFEQFLKDEAKAIMDRRRTFDEELGWDAPRVGGP